MTAPDNPLAGFDDRARAGVAILADALLPGTARLPRALDVGAHKELLDRVFRADPDLVAPVVEVGHAVADKTSLDLENLRHSLGESFERALFALSAAYYMAPVVQRALAYPGQTRRPVSLATPEELCTPELLAPVIARGPVYVPTPTDVG